MVNPQSKFFVVLFLTIIIVSISGYAYGIVSNSSDVKETDDKEDQSVIDYLFDNNFFSIVLSTGLFIAAGFIFSKMRGVMNTLNSIKEMQKELLAQKDAHIQLQESTKLMIEECLTKIDNQKLDFDRRLEALRDDQYKIKDETHKIIMEYLFDLRKKTSSGM